MKERPILFSAPMVRAILEGRKTQTRRIVKPQLPWDAPRNISCHRLDDGRFGFFSEDADFPCPYGAPGDRLWVREEHFRFGHWEPVEGVKTKGGRQKWRFVADRDDVLFDGAWLTGSENCGKARVSMNRENPEISEWHKRLARFMPRRFSRITLEVVSVRVERLNDISEEDAIAEGVSPVPVHGKWVERPRAQGGHWSARKAFSDLWESINGAGSWDANPHVWVVEFKAVT